MCRAVFRTGFARCPLDGEALIAIDDDPLAGATFADRYVIEDCIGEGGMGRVYRARHQRVSRRFAIKVLFGDHAADGKMRERFAREAEAASRLNHPNVVSVVDFGETPEGLPYLVMDFVEGRELGRIVAEEGPLDAGRVRKLLRQLCAGLAHAHGEGLVHRDFKGENVIVTEQGEVEVPRIVDFGIAVIAELAEAGRLTTEGVVVGTPAFMSPEQAMGAELDHRTDLYSLGVLAYEMLAGCLPFEGTPLAVARQNLSVLPPSIAERVPGLSVDPELEAIAMKLLAKKPDDRFPSAEAVIEALDAVGRAAPVASLADTVSARTVDAGVTDEVVAMSRPRRWPVVVAALVLLGGGLGVWLATRGGDDAAQAPVVTAPIDAGAVAMPTPMVDAGEAAAPRDAAGEVAVVEPPPLPGGSASKRVGPVKKDPPKADAREADPPPVAPPVAPPAKPMTTKSLTELYVSVGESIEALTRARGGAAAIRFRNEYGHIAFQDALRNPDMRAEVAERLRKLKKRVDAAR